MFGSDQNENTKPHGGVDTEAPVELTALAERLRQARQEQGISQDALCQRLNMGLQQLEALEQANLAALPEQVFVVAQARRVAAALGIDISDQVDCLRQTRILGSRGSGSRPVPVPAAGAQPDSADGSGPDGAAGGRLLRALGILFLIAGVGVGGWQLQRRLSVSLPSASPAATRPVPKPIPRPVSRPLTRQVPKPAAVLLLQTRQPSWIEVRSQAGGEVLFRGTLVGERRLPLGQGLRVLAGRPDLVSVSHGGAPARVLGPISAVQWYSFGAGRQQSP